MAPLSPGVRSIFRSSLLVQLNVQLFCIVGNNSIHFASFMLLVAVLELLLLHMTGITCFQRFTTDIQKIRAAL